MMLSCVLSSSPRSSKPQLNQTPARRFALPRFAPPLFAPPAFAGGGWLESKFGGETGRRSSEIIHIVDWYATIAALAGIEDGNISDKRAEESTPSLPPIDSRDQRALLEGGSSAWEGEPLFLSSNAVMLDDFKLILSPIVAPAGFPGPTYPNASSFLSPVDDPKLDLNCTNGCLFNIAEDKEEHIDLASSMPEKVEELKSMLVEGRKTFYENSDELVMDCDGDDFEEQNCGCHLAVNKWGGYFGPYASSP